MNLGLMLQAHIQSHPKTFEAVLDDLAGLLMIIVSRDILSERDGASQVLNLGPAM